MSVFRWLTLSLGPLLLVGLSYALTRPTAGVASTTAARLRLPPLTAPISDLPARCEAAAHDYRTQFPETWSWLVCTPFVLGSDLETAQLEQIYRQTLAPTARALTIGYFDHAPTEPIIVLICSSAEVYRQCIRLLGDGERAEYAGIYVRQARRLVLNLSTGEGTLAHELTHALAHVDFPHMPEWFDEGLASLHEESQFSDDGLRLLGAPNWRGELLKQALASRQLPSLAVLLTQAFGRQTPALDYAQARYLCLFLQEKHLLGAYYRKCRANISIDPTGGWSLLQILGYERIEDIDAEYQNWLATLTTSPP